jgi:hypothetical protein
MKHILVAISIALVIGIQTLAVMHTVDKSIQDYHHSRPAVMTR